MANPVTPLDAAETKEAEAIASVNPYPIRVLIALDVFLNVLFLCGNLDESISGHAGRAASEGKLWGLWLCRFLNLFSSNHGAKAIASDTEHAKQVIELDEKSGDITP